MKKTGKKLISPNKKAERLSFPIDSSQPSGTQSKSISLTNSRIVPERKTLPNNILSIGDAVVLNQNIFKSFKSRKSQLSFEANEGELLTARALMSTDLEELQGVDRGGTFRVKPAKRMTSEDRYIQMRHQK